MQKLTLAAMLLAAASCTAPTSYDVVAFTDGMRYLIPTKDPPTE